MCFFLSTNPSRIVLSCLVFLALGFEAGSMRVELFAQQGAATSDDSSWPTFLGPNQDGKSNLTKIRKDWSGGKLELLWQH